jgi:hypothetical protein
MILGISTYLFIYLCGLLVGTGILGFCVRHFKIDFDDAAPFILVILMWPLTVTFAAIVIVCAIPYLIGLIAAKLIEERKG